MKASVMQGSFLLLPVSENSTLYLVSKQGTESFATPKSVDMLTLKSLLHCNEIEQVSSAALEPRNDIINEGIRNAYTTKYSSITKGN